MLLESVGDVFEKDQPEDNVLVLRRVHVVPELVGRLPKFGFKAKVGCGITRASLFDACHGVGGKSIRLNWIDQGSV